MCYESWFAVTLLFVQVAPHLTLWLFKSHITHDTLNSWHFKYSRCGDSGHRFKRPDRCCCWLIISRNKTLIVTNPVVNCVSRLWHEILTGYFCIGFRYVIVIGRSGAVVPCVLLTRVWMCVCVCVCVCVCTCGYMLCACVSACVDYISPWSKQCSGTAPDGYSNGIRVYTHTHTHTHTHVEIHTQAAAAWRTWAARAGARGAGKIRREHEAGIHEGWVQVVSQMFLH
jgi:hypothetical protein